MQIQPPNPPSENGGTHITVTQVRLFLREYLEKEFWTPVDACLLIHLIHPQDPSLDLIQPSHLPSDVRKLLTLVGVEVGHELKSTVVNGRHQIRPKDFSDWLYRRGIIPPQLFTDSIRRAQGEVAVTANALRKAETQEKYKAWNDAYAELRSRNKNVSESSASLKIAKMDIGQGCAAETIRKHLHSPPKKVGR